MASCPGTRRKPDGRLVANGEDLFDHHGMRLGRRVLAGARMSLQDLLDCHPCRLFLPQATRAIF
jgi:hypothetical protein